jgi:hypothetical protein
MRNYEFGTFLEKSSFSQKRRRNFRISKKTQITRNHEKLNGYCKLTPVFVSSIGETSKTSTTLDFFQKTHFSKIS